MGVVRDIRIRAWFGQPSISKGFSREPHSGGKDKMMDRVPGVFISSSSVKGEWCDIQVEQIQTVPLLAVGQPLLNHVPGEVRASCAVSQCPWWRSGHRRGLVTVP